MPHGPEATLCSRNEHKLRELEAALPGWTLRSSAASYRRRRARPTTRTPARRRSSAASVGTGATPGCSARTRGSRSTRSAARPACARRAGPTSAVRRALLEELGGESRPPRPRCLRSSSRSRRTAAELSVSRRRSKDEIANEPRGHGGLRLRPGLRPGGRERTVAELGDDWKRAQLAPRRGRRAALRAALRLAAPVDLGAEDDHVRHHVEPDQEQQRPADHLRRRVVLRDAEEDRQHLEGRLQRDGRDDRARAAPRDRSASTFGQVPVGADEEDEDRDRRRRSPRRRARRTCCRGSPARSGRACARRRRRRAGRRRASTSEASMNSDRARLADAGTRGSGGRRRC